VAKRENMNAHGTQLQFEIEEQPDVLARLLRDGWPEVVRAAEQIRAFKPEWVIIASRGTSDNAARYAQYLFGAHHQLGVALAAPSLITLYGVAPRLDRALTIGISQSGQSPDVVSVVEAARQQGGATLAITNDPKSPLAAAAKSCVRLGTGEERAVAATKTYTGELMALAMLSVALDGSASRREELQYVPVAVAAALATARAGMDHLASAYRNEQRFVVIGRGFNYCTAHEIALKMKETSYVVAEPYSVADLLHGPVAMIDEGFPIVLAAPSGLGSDVEKLLAVVEKRGARLIALSDRAEVLERAHSRIALPTGVPEWLSPIVTIAPGQVFARSLAIAKGHDPDVPRGLAKVTLTH
jgi:glucosamine--fructose-6-phosphate aminotransferase (isomerizing)